MSVFKPQVFRDTGPTGVDVYVEECSRLRAENEKLRGALEYYADPDNWGLLPKDFSGSMNDVLRIDTGNGYDRAKEALGEQGVQ